MAESICVGCGMCCDGTLFGRVKVGQRDDRDALQRLGFELKVIADEEWFPQPCQAVADGCCTVYDERPRTCRKFRCALLVKHEDDGLPRAEAVAIIAKTAAIRDRIRASMTDVLGDTTHLSIAGTRARLQQRLDTTDEPSDHTRLLLDLAAFDLMVRRHFELPPPAENPTKAAP